MSEREIKLHVEPDRRGRLLDALGRRRMRRSALSAVYFDTPDGLLARHRFALRLRREDGHWVQTLKGKTGRTDDRLEHEVAIDGADGATPSLDLERHRRSVVGRRLRALLKKHGQPALGESCRTEVTRQSRLLRAHDAVVEWSLDEGAVTAGGRSQPICELELEFKGGDAAGLYAVAHDWEALHGLWIDPVSKSERGALLHDETAFRAPVRAAPIRWGAGRARDMDGATMLRRMVAACLAQVVPNAGEIARGSRDPEQCTSCASACDACARPPTACSRSRPACRRAGRRPSAGLRRAGRRARQARPGDDHRAAAAQGRGGRRGPRGALRGGGAKRPATGARRAVPGGAPAAAGVHGRAGRAADRDAAARAAARGWSSS